MSKIKLIIALLVIVGLFYNFTQNNNSGARYNKATTQYLAGVMDTKQSGGAGEVKQNNPIIVEAKTEEVKNSDGPNGVFVNDSNFEDIIKKTQTYKDKYFPTSPVDSRALVMLAKAENFPIDFLLVSGHLESHLCTAGRGADSLNCHNVNNTDNGDGKATVCGQYTECLSDVMTGEIKFINLIKNCYFKEGVTPTIQGFIDQDFRIQRTIMPFCSAGVGARYMTDTGAINKYINAVQNFINPIFTIKF
jgi:hypothetical protein